MKAVFAFVAVLAVFGLAFAADDDDDHSNHCHIDDYPTIHIDIGKSIDLPGACLKLYCKNTDLFEVVNTCKHASEAENKSFADKLVKGQVCN